MCLIVYLLHLLLLMLVNHLVMEHKNLEGGKELGLILALEQMYLVIGFLIEKELLDEQIVNVSTVIMKKDHRTFKEAIKSTYSNFWKEG